MSRRIISPERIVSWRKSPPRRFSVSTHHLEEDSGNRDKNDRTLMRSSNEDKRRQDKNVRNNLDKHASYSRQRKDVARREDRYSAYDHSSRSKREMLSLAKQLKECVQTEHQHIIRKELNSSGDGYNYVEWCPKYLRPDIVGHATGGRAVLHHLCRTCGAVCLHLVGKYGTSNRKCLLCISYEYGWAKKDIPDWYFHKHRCKYCK